MKNIKTFQDACKAIGVDPATVLPDVSAYPDFLQRHLLAAAKILIINKALNKDWVPDYETDNDGAAEPKYFVKFDADAAEAYPDGVGVHEISNYESLGSSTLLNQYKTEKLAEYAGKQFLPLFKDLYTF